MMVNCSSLCDRGRFEQRLHPLENQKMQRFDFHWWGGAGTRWAGLEASLESSSGNHLTRHSRVLQATTQQAESYLCYSWSSWFTTCNAENPDRGKPLLGLSSFGDVQPHFFSYCSQDSSTLCLECIKSM